MAGPRLHGDPEKYIRRVKGGKWQARPYCSIEGQRYDLGLFESPGEASRAVLAFWQGKRPEVLRFTRAYAGGERFAAVVPCPDPTGKRSVVIPGFESREAAHAAAVERIRATFPPDRVESVMKRQCHRSGIGVEGLLVLLRDAGYIPEPFLAKGERRWKRSRVIAMLRARAKTQEAEPVPEGAADSEGESLLIDLTQIARLLSRGVNATAKDARAGLLPAPIRLGTCLRWRRSEILSWIESRCPPRDDWAKIWAAQQPGAVQPGGNAQLASA